MHAVVANELEIGKVIVVTNGGEKLLERKSLQADVEIPLINLLIALRTDYIEADQEQSLDLASYSKPAYHIDYGSQVHTHSPDPSTANANAYDYSNLTTP